MANPLSIAASSFAVLGAAEQVCRTIKELCTFLSAIKSAPAEIRPLQSQLLDLDIILEDVRAYWSESQSLPCQRDIVPAFISSLNGFKHELQVLRLSFNLPTAGKVDLGERIKWVLLKEQKAVQSIQRLESHKVMLIAALTVVGRRNDVVLHKNLGIIRDQLDGLTVKQDESKKVPQRIFQLPSKLGDFFTGRDKELDLIQKF